MKTKFEEPGTIAKPRLLGRLVRIALGVTTFYFLAWPYIDLWRGYTRVREGSTPPGGTWWLPILLIFFLLPHLIDVGLNFRLGNKSRVAFGVLLGLAAALNYTLYGGVWGPVLGWFLILTGVLVFTHLSIAFLVQGVVATPGCEVRSILHVLGRMRGVEVAEHG